MIGFINVYKPSNMTSNFVVQKVRKRFGISKIGHMGTLDPLASGILPLAVGKATRLFDYMLEKVKMYRVTYEFGYETDTLDSTGNVINTCDFLPSRNDILAIIKSMIGKQNQIPPKYSAKNVNGSRAYDLARKGIDFELKPKEIEIFDISLTDYNDKSCSFEIRCSAGTYIRAIGRDIAYKLNSLATMTRLERCETGVFTLSNAIQFDDLLNTNNLNDVILSPLDVFKNYDQIVIDYNQYIDLKNGKKIKYKYLDKNSFLIYEDIIVGICKSGKDYLKLDTYLEG